MVRLSAALSRAQTKALTMSELQVILKYQIRKACITHAITEP